MVGSWRCHLWCFQCGGDFHSCWWNTTPAAGLMAFAVDGITSCSPGIVAIQQHAIGNSLKTRWANNGENCSCERCLSCPPFWFLGNITWLYIVDTFVVVCYCSSTGDTHWYVLHAEANAITKVSASTQSSEGSTLYVTLSPCRDCSKLIHQAKIKRVVYNEQYKDTSGLEFLQNAGVEVCQIEI